ncbi:hypothetical protein CHS0354_023325 [Potamilus streckersoni]|uniref:Mannose-P-dolichol utilization defect 1 protein homolog n=1 Tax=Potamilus streckersoni TaxID=2493646 RepID=A0AAE0T4K9_9BIVA|nr:hypothetical protein CHS0354_023325 [Potamilus streckersoni]
MTENGFIAKTVQILVPQPCFSKFFVDLNFLDVACLKTVVSKCLGFAIILGSLIVKVPQIIKIVRAKSGKGISFSSVLFELIAITANTSYSFAKGFPFSSYGEGLFLAIQTSLIAFFVILYRGSLLNSGLFLGAYGAIMAYLLSPAAPIQLLAFLQSVNILIVILSKMIQVVANYQNGSTGQLSAVTVFLLFLGSVARIFTSIQETGDSLVISTYMVASVCNGLLASQILYYWNTDRQTKTK